MPLIIYLLGVFVFLLILRHQYFYLSLIWPLFVLAELIFLPFKLQRIRKQREEQDRIHAELDKLLLNLLELHKRGKDGTNSGVSNSIGPDSIDSVSSNKEEQK